jgi:serine acetyltransferase
VIGRSFDRRERRSARSASGPSFRDRVLQDWGCNPEGKSRVLLAWYRLAHLCRRTETPFPRLLERIIDRLYRMMTSWVLGAEIHPDVSAGPRLRMYHAHNIVLHPDVVVGSDCVLRAGVCIGTTTDSNGVSGPAPRIGDHVDIGVGALVIGDVAIGDRVRIGAGAVVVKDVPADVTVAGNPARVLTP